ncbi:2-hydroxyacid dehydrogenase [Burkholderia sp. Ac-20379]|uniref:2-hydroxyacid dehydrogenase n=1 Tax=Burkholderia sp. Ac-20379 TaxID=2703900 RepID=UPI00197D4D58|nr:2-hydroxyacid dehydrogenase [Burkholderia sp. Ac-20379]MBN3727004.1 2-hydroxyacid dehydrogenase [Burkholderia sp. Ac-20379]
MKPSLLVLIAVQDDARARLADAYELIYAPDAASREQAIDTRGADVELVLTNGTTGLSEADLARLPKLGFLHALGVGYENLPVAAARARGIAMAHGVGANDDCVADHAFALLLAAVRGVVRLDAACRAGVWRDALPMQPNFSSKRLGIVGLGRIGEKVARRAGGFDLEVGYHNRRPRDGAAFRYFDALADLAGWADYLLVATPGGAQTRHLVDAAILDALGPRGFLVNVSRGSTVDTAALAAALRDGRIAGAGLDVYESEPAPPGELIGLDNVVLTPHVAGTSPEARDRTIDLFLENAERHFSGLGLVTPLEG